MKESKKIQNKFNLLARMKSFTHAGRGIYIFMMTTHNAWIHGVVVLLVVIFGILLKISHIEWLLIILAIGFVLSAEAFNTAIEIDIDLTSPEYHPYARDTKDVAAGAVLIASIAAMIIGLVIFIPKIISFFL